MRKIAKYPILGINQDDDVRSIPQGFFREIRNGIPISLSKGGIQPVPGTTERPGGGTGTCIGAFTDAYNNRIVYFLFNEVDGHSIWYFNPSTNTHTQVFTSIDLNFSEDSPITTCDFLGDTLIFSDGLNEPHHINVTDAIAGIYDTSGSFLGETNAVSQFTFERPHPRTPPVPVRSTDAGVSINNITADSWQFAVQLVFRDNTVSFFSPLSPVVEADVKPIPTSLTNNYISVTHTLDDDQTSIVKSIRFAYVKNGNGQYNVFAETTASGTVSFYNNEPITIVDPNDLLQVNFVPTQSKNVVIHGQRILATMDQFDYADVGSPFFFLAITAWSSATTPKIHLPGSSYTYGLVHFDKFMRTNGVTSEFKISIPNVTSTGAGLGVTPSGQPLWIGWSLSGTPPSWAKFVAIVRKKNSTISSSFTVPGLVMFYMRDDTTSAFAEVLDDGKVFHEGRQNGWDQNIHIKLPSNIPVSIDNTYRVRMLDNKGQTRLTENILDIQGDKIVCGNFGITNWAALQLWDVTFRFEKYRDAPDEFFYEIGQVYTISDNTYQTSSGTIYGDHFARTFEGYNYEPFETAYPNYRWPGYTTQAGAASPTASLVVTESPTTASFIRAKSFISHESSTREIPTDTRVSNKESVRKNRLIGALVAGPIGALLIGEESKRFEPVFESNVTEAEAVFTWDYNKRVSDNGRTWVAVRNKKINSEPTTITISDKYVFSSKINGFNKFSNLYTIPPNRTPVRKLINIGISNILLAIHERTTTSLATYSGDNILQTSDGSEITGDGTSIIGYDRELAGGFGTLYPDSVYSFGSKAWWFDPYKGEICRYAANGVTPIASIYKMKNFFLAKGNQFIDTTDRNVITGYDPKLQMVLFTFRSAIPEEEITVGFIDKEGEERWYAFYDFIPDRYASINNRLFSFVNGTMYEHNISSTYNSFYGEQATFSLQHVFNADFDKEKIVRGVALSGSEALSVTSVLVEKPATRDQETYLNVGDFTRRDDNWYADLRRDINSPGAGSETFKRNTGDILIGKSYTVDFENDSDEYFDLFTISYPYQEAQGHDSL